MPWPGFGSRGYLLPRWRRQPAKSWPRSRNTSQARWSPRHWQQRPASRWQQPSPRYPPPPPRRWCRWRCPVPMVDPALHGFAIGALFARPSTAGVQAIACVPSAVGAATHRRQAASQRRRLGHHPPPECAASGSGARLRWPSAAAHAGKPRIPAAAIAGRCGGMCRPRQPSPTAGVNSPTCHDRPIS